MEVKYIIESRYYNGDKYADKFDSLSEVAEILREIEQLDTDEMSDGLRIDSKQISITTEEQ